MNDQHTQNGAATSRDEERRALLTAYALGQLEGKELQQFEAELRSPEGAALHSEPEQIRRLAGALKEAAAGDGGAEKSPELRAALLQCLDAQMSTSTTSTAATSPSCDSNKVELDRKSPAARSRWIPVALVGGALALLVAVLAIPQVQDRLTGSWLTADARAPQAANGSREWETHATVSPETTPVMPDASTASELPVASPESQSLRFSAGDAQRLHEPVDETRWPAMQPQFVDPVMPADSTSTEFGRSEKRPLNLSAAPQSGLDFSYRGRADVALHNAPAAGLEAKPTASPSPSTSPSPSVSLPRILVESEEAPLAPQPLGTIAKANARGERKSRDHVLGLKQAGPTSFSLAPGTEQYDPIVENMFFAPAKHPLSTFSIDVDTASYANVRRFLTSGRLPPPSAVRLEELVNYFRYDYPQPKGDEPFSVNLEMAECPWQEGHRLLRVGLQGKDVHRGERPASNLVFLLDVSGSMDEPNKLPLVKHSLSMLVQELTENDRVSIVTYAGNAGLVLPPTSGDQKQKILAAIESLTPGGSTHGSAGIRLAYDLAKEYFRKNGTNRVILATDGDLNVGVTSDEALVELIKEKAQGGTFLTVLGFGEGNLKDSKMEKLADNGNGIYAYIDGAREGRKVLVEQMTGSLITIAKDVKIQIEFNPAEVAAYRLLGYENRILAAEDFNNDQKDAGEIGAGHSVTALYEIVPVGAKAAVGKTPEEAPGVDPLKYQASGRGFSIGEPTEKPAGAEDHLTEAAKSGELLTLKLRYKEPDGDTSKLLEYPLTDKGGSFNAASKEMQFAAAVASFGMVLRQSEHRGTSNLATVEEIATGALGKDDGGYRAEFVDLVKRAATLGVK